MNRIYLLAFLALTLLACSKSPAGSSVDQTPPSAPSSVKPSSVTSNSLILSWTASIDNVGVAFYAVYKGVDTSNKIGTTPASQTSLPITGLPPNTQYTFTVRAVDASGNISNPSEALTIATSAATTGDTTPPTAPTNLQASSVTTTSLTLSWSAASDNSGTIAFYDVYANGSKITSVLGSTLSANVVGLTPNTSYSFTVKALDPSGNASVASNAVAVTTISSGTTGGPTANQSDLIAASQSHDASASKVRDGSNQEISSYLTNLQAPFTLNLPSFLGLPDFFGQVAGLIGAQSVAAQVSSTLPRGSWDCTSGNCAQTANNDYYVKWKTGSAQIAEIYLNWDGSSLGPASPTVKGHLAADPTSNIEVPTHLVGYLKLAGNKLMSLDRRVSYPQSSCVSNSYVIDVPNSQKLVLSLNRADGSSLLKVNNFATTLSSNGLTTQGDIAASSGGETITATWNLTTSGQALQGSCGQYGGIIATSLSGTALTSNGKYTLDFTVGGDQFKTNPSGIRFTDSVLKIGNGSGTKTVNFKGATDDTNKNCVIGDNLTLSFADGQTTLEQYLIANHKALPCK
ncbi:MAG: fibronectin type III domain-containing protein [Thermaceae bacterium]|nr:fibronectin type III domain-containing protein [Thermaceae bacterium]